MLQVADEDTQRLADNPRAGDETLLVRFTLEPLENTALSKVEGRLICEEKEFITIRAPGAKDTVKRVASRFDRNRFARHYAAFKAGLADPEVGSPLKEWPIVTRSQVEMLAYKGVKTVEQLAGVADSNLMELGPGAVTLKQKAKDWLERAKGNAPAERHRADLAEANGKIEVLMRAVETLQKNQGLPATPLVEVAPKRNRKRKDS